VTFTPLTLLVQSQENCPLMVWQVHGCCVVVLVLQVGTGLARPVLLLETQHEQDCEEVFPFLRSMQEHSLVPRVAFPYWTVLGEIARAQLHDRTGCPWNDGQLQVEEKVLATVHRRAGRAVRLASFMQHLQMVRFNSS
jgi:hypothetical protein